MAPGEQNWEGAGHHWLAGCWAGFPVQEPARVASAGAFQGSHAAELGAECRAWCQMQTQMLSAEVSVSSLPVRQLALQFHLCRIGKSRLCAVAHSCNPSTLGDLDRWIT